MSLDWSIENIKNHDELCWLPAKPGQTDAQRDMNPVTRSLIMSTMAVDMAEITKKNAEEFFIRLDAYQRSVGPFMHMSSDKEPLCPELLVAAEQGLEVVEHYNKQAQNEQSHGLELSMRGAITRAKEPRILDVFITYEEVVAHIGLTTNVSTKSRAHFEKRLGVRLTVERERSLRHELSNRREVKNEQSVDTAAS